MDTVAKPTASVDGYLESCYRAFLRGEPESGLPPDLDRSLGPDARGQIDEVIDRLRHLAAPGRSRRGRPGARGAAANSSSGDLPQVPGYEVTEFLGSGGFGRVYRAVSRRHFGVAVALKIIKAERIEDEDHALDGRRRLLASLLVSEARVLAHLGHRHIVRYYGSGIVRSGAEAGTPYIATELIDGTTLAERAGGRPQDPRWSAEILVKVADALEFVHELKLSPTSGVQDDNQWTGILHRDVKPANILLGRDGQPYLTDFGLAGRVGRASGEDGVLAATPAFAAPEQLAEDAVLTPAVDVYGLGGTLYFLLTGRPPRFEAAGGDEKSGAAGRRLVRPGRLVARVPSDLECICLKCLEAEPTRRYPGARAVRDDLQRFLDGKPVSVNPVGPLGYAVRWGRRYPVVALLSLGLVIAVVAGLGGGATFWTLAVAERRQAEANFVHASDSLNWFPALLRDSGSRQAPLSLGPKLVPHLQRAREHLLALLRDRPNHAETYHRLASLDAGMGLIYCGESRWDEARPLLLESTAILERFVGQKSETERLLELRDNLAALVELSQSQGNVEESIGYELRNIAILEHVMELQSNPDAGIVALLADARLSLATTMTRRGGVEQARQLLAANAELLGGAKADVDPRSLAIRRVIGHDELRRLGADVKPAPTTGLDEVKCRALDGLTSADSDGMGADAWADLFTRVLLEPSQATKRPSDREASRILDTIKCFDRRVAGLRNSGLPAEADRWAARMHALSLRLRAIQPGWAVSFLALSESHVQLYKQARRTGDRRAMESHLRQSLEAARDALILEPDHDLARRSAVRLRDRYEALMAEFSAERKAGPSSAPAGRRN